MSIVVSLLKDHIQYHRFSFSRIIDNFWDSILIFWDLILFFEIWSSFLRFDPHFWDLILNFETLSLFLRLNPHFWELILNLEIKWGSWRSKRSNSFAKSFWLTFELLLKSNSWVMSYSLSKLFNHELLLWSNSKICTFLWSGTQNIGRALCLMSYSSGYIFFLKE